MRTIGINAAAGREGALQAHLDAGATFMCSLLQIRTRDGTYICTTSLDRDFTYDDGSGAKTYKSLIGADIMALDASAELDVDNSEAVVLLVDSGDVTRQKVEAGTMDYARYKVMTLCYADPDMGYYIPPSGTGYTGVVKAVDGLAGLIELRGLSQWAKQNFVPLYSKTCRARFGGAQCGVDTTALWVNGAVDTVSAEPDRVFTATAAPTLSGYTFVPGLIEWLTGNNAGLFSEIEAIDTANIALLFGTRYDIQAGDTYRIRPDCDKTKATCKDVFNNLLEFRGEADIPLGDEGTNQMPGASSAPYFPGAVTDFNEDSQTVGDVADDPPPVDTLVGTENVFARFENSGLYSYNAIRTSSVDFIAAGYTRDMNVVVSGSGSNDRTFGIHEVYADWLWVQGEMTYDPGVSCTLSFYQ